MFFDIQKRVYPRTHGGTLTQQIYEEIRNGSIPVHTGEPGAACSFVIYYGSIPVHTGEPPILYAYTSLVRGLSPYTRGNLYKRILLLTP